jgi:hypothetical protein
METHDAIEDLIETSDAEEREFDEAKKPGYYTTLWGAWDKVRLLHCCRCIYKIYNAWHAHLPLLSGV